MAVLAAYNFEEGTGVAITDVSGNANGLTLGTSGQWVTGYHGSFAIQSRTPHVQSYDGAGAYGAFPGGSPFETPLSIAFWARPTAMPDGWSAYIGVLNSWDGEVMNIQVLADGSIASDWVSNTGDHSPVATSQVGDLIHLNEWAHITAVFRPGTGAILYVNGTVATQYEWQESSTSFQGNWSDMLVGASRWGSGGAQIDDLSLHDEALTPVQIAALMGIPPGETPSENTNQLRLGNTTPTALYLGSTPVSRAYLGTTLVYGAASAGGGPTNTPPVASFTTSTSGMTVTANASASSDSDGTIAGYAWNWGDSTSGSGVNASHTYTVEGSYVITLTVTDNTGATHSTSRSAAVSSGGFIANLINNPSAGGYPDATNTGVPSGVTLTSSGSITVTVNGTVIENRNIVNGSITVNADNVIIRNCHITTYDYYPIENNGSGLLVEDCEITGTLPSVTAAISFGGYTARRCNVSGSADGLKANYNTTIEDCYIHDLAVSEGSHNDGIQSTGGSTVTVHHNTIDTNTSGVAIQFGSADSDWTVSDNLIRATGWAINGGTSTTNSTFTNNRFAAAAGWYGPSSLSGTGIVWSGNYSDADGSSL